MVNVIFFYARLFLLYYLSRVIKKRRRRLRTTGFKEEMWISDEMKSFLCVYVHFSLPPSFFFSRSVHIFDDWIGFRLSLRVCVEMRCFVYMSIGIHSSIRGLYVLPLPLSFA